MKKILFSLSACLLLAACDSDKIPVPKTRVQQEIQKIMAGSDGKVDMARFAADAQKGVIDFGGYELTYTNGETCDQLDGAGIVHNMMLLPGGECRTFNLFFDFNPKIPPLYQQIEWSLSDEVPNAIELFDPEIEASAPVNNYDEYKARTTLEVLYYQNGIFVMKGIQPYAYWGGLTDKGIYKDYCLMYGEIRSDQTTIDTYLSYEEYDSYRAEHPDLIP